MNIDHVGVAVASLEDGIAFYEKLGLKVAHREDVPTQKVRVAFLQAGEAAVELLEPTSDEGAIAKFLKTKGPGLHHVAFHVEKVGENMERLKALGLPPLEASPRPGARGHHVCFLHPKHANGVLVELVGNP